MSVAQRFLKFSSFAIVLAISYLFPRRESEWVFIAGEGDRFAENSKYLFLYCIKERDEISASWIGTSEGVVSELRESGFSAYKHDSILGRFRLLRAGVAIETHGPQFGKNLGGATVIDTHHGNALKKMGTDVSEANLGVMKRLKRYLWDSFVGPSNFVVTNIGTPLETFRKAKNLDSSKFIIAPYPRLDVFYQEDKNFNIRTCTQELDKISSMSEQHDIIFYTPTWRNAFGKENGFSLSNIKPNFEKIDRLLKQRDSFMYVSSHPHDELDIPYDQYERVFLLENGDDLYPFLQYCDILITDYSSIFYDFTFEDKPILFYAPDLEQYKSTRGLYFDYEEHVPGPVSESTDELCADLESALNGIDRYEKDRAELQEEFFTDCYEYPSYDAFSSICDEIS
ncbi:CDP-glycerol glycerophosphotransferase family protein [Halococcus qingdaonensis]|uniref:CDP-glycerol glycerophosphotransferase family protein n=1 Tax=Halococcus qingdaonensis TaxID=224402 RepID=UPI002116E397|nr:CDP-glycerol glycerophosphotransferase family protein [Halococcus qingdaonensis]